MSNFPLNLGILASHEGTNLQVILDACNQKAINASVNVVISNNSDSRALKRAKEANVLALHMSTITHLNEHKLDIAITEIMKSNQVNLILLAGYMKKLDLYFFLDIKIESLIVTRLYYLCTVVKECLVI